MMALIMSQKYMIFMKISYMKKQMIINLSIVTKTLYVIIER